MAPTPLFFLSEQARRRQTGQSLFVRDTRFIQAMMKDVTPSLAIQLEQPAAVVALQLFFEGGSVRFRSVGAGRWERGWVMVGSW